MFKKYFIPHKDNDHQPHLLRSGAVLVILVGLLLIEAAFLFQIFILWPYTNLFSSILPSVLVDLTNSNRNQNHILPLRVNSLLEEAAKLKAQDMAQNGYFSHTSPEGVTPWYWLEKVGYRYSGAGENLAVNFSDSSDIAKAWMNSSTHRANILDNRFSEIGIATAQGIYQDQETIFVVQFFGRPPAPGAKKPEPVKPSPAKAEPPAQPWPQPEPTPGPLVEPETMAIVNQESATSNPAVASAQISDNQLETVAAQSSPWRRFLSMPKVIAGAIYLTIGIIFLLALALAIFIKIKVQYPRLIANGLLVLFVIVSLLYLNYLIIGQGQIFN